MIDKAIIEFLDDKKNDFLKKKVNKDSSDENLELHNQANDKFSLKNWLIDSSNRASQLSETTHPAKFVHPTATTTNLIANCKKKDDGFLRSGNVTVDLDVYGAASALDVEKFLRIKFSDNTTILQHLEDDTDFIKAQFDIKDINYNEIRNNYLKIKTSTFNQTDYRLKQVYFPVNDNYHLLSILIPSGIIYKLKEKVNAIRFSDENKKVRAALNKLTPINSKIEDVKNLTGLGYGGTQPQNISVLNSANGGISLLLLSMPPQFHKRKTQSPKTCFFDNCLWSDLFKDDFQEFNRVLVDRKNNKPLRDERDDIVLNSITKAQRLVDNVRSAGIGWSRSSTYSKLENWQKIWLDDKNQETREDYKNNENYLQKAQSGFANWFIGNYKSAINDSKTLGADDINHIEDILSQEQELLK